MSNPNTIDDAANQAMSAAKVAMGAEDGTDVYQMNGTDQGNITKFAVALIEWDAARMTAQAAESRKKPTPPAARS